MDALLKEIGQVAVFLICAQTLLHFRAKEDYEKYIKLLISMMLLILLAEPFLDLLSREGKDDFSDKIKSYEQEISSVMGSGWMQEAEIEVFLRNITEEKVAEGAEYVQSAEQQAEEKTEGDVNVQEEVAGQEQIRIEQIKIGGANGES